MASYRDSILTKIVLTLFFIAVIMYAYFEVRGLLYGPHINVTSSIATSHDQYVLISGNADHIASLFVNGAPVSVTIDGSFHVPYLLAPGVNDITFDARDNYGRTTSETVKIVYVASGTPTLAADTASSSIAAPTTKTMPTTRQPLITNATSSTALASTTSPQKTDSRKTTSSPTTSMAPTR